MVLKHYYAPSITWLRETIYFSTLFPQLVVIFPVVPPGSSSLGLSGQPPCNRTDSEGWRHTGLQIFHINLLPIFSEMAL